MAVTVFITPQAQKQLDALPNVVHAAITKKLESLRAYPQVARVRPLHGVHKGSLRIRCGDYRIVFHVEGGKAIVTIIDDRKDVYSRDVEDDMTRSVREVVTKVRTAEDRPVEAVGFARRSLGAKLRKMRLDAGLTQSALARRIKRAASTVGLAEQGRISVSEKYVEAAIRACGLG